MLWVARWITNFGNGFQQSQEIEAKDYQQAFAKAEKLANKRRATLVEVTLADDE